MLKTYGVGENTIFDGGRPKPLIAAMDETLDWLSHQTACGIVQCGVDSIQVLIYRGFVEAEYLKMASWKFSKPGVLIHTFSSSH